MTDCGGGKNGSGSHASFAVAISHRVRNNANASSHGARRCKSASRRPSRLPATVTTKMAPDRTKAAIASSRVRDQSPISGHHRHATPKPTHARLANTPIPPDGNETGSDTGRPASAAPSSADCASATALDTEYVDIDALRKFRCVGAWLEYRNLLQVFGIAL